MSQPSLSEDKVLQLSHVRREPPNSTEVSTDVALKIFEQVMELWILPEVDRQQACGKLEKPVALRKAQVVFHTDGRGREVRLNDEARIFVTIRTARPRTINAGDELFDEDIAAIETETMSLSDDDDPNAGHVSLFNFHGAWHIACDFRFNRSLVARHLAVAIEFLESARYALMEQRIHVFADNLFSAAELGAKAYLLGLMQVSTKTNHSAIHARFNRQAASGGVNEESRSAFNRLARARSAFRYLEGEAHYSPDELASWIPAVEELLDLVRRRNLPKK
jgi:HEPN domain-containing protein